MLRRSSSRSSSNSDNAPEEAGLFLSPPMPLSISIGEPSLVESGGSTSEEFPMSMIPTIKIEDDSKAAQESWKKEERARKEQLLEQMYETQRKRCAATFNRIIYSKEVFDEILEAFSYENLKKQQGFVVNTFFEDIEGVERHFHAGKQNMGDSFIKMEIESNDPVIEETIGWKLVISTLGTETECAKAWNVILPILIRYNLSVSKYITPEKVAMPNNPHKQITIYALKSPNRNWHQICYELEQALLLTGVIPGGRPTPDLQITGSRYLYYRNDNINGRYANSTGINNPNPMNFPDIFADINVTTRPVAKILHGFLSYIERKTRDYKEQADKNTVINNLMALLKECRTGVFIELIKSQGDIIKDFSESMFKDLVEICHEKFTSHRAIEERLRGNINDSNRDIVENYSIPAAEVKIKELQALKETLQELALVSSNQELGNGAQRVVVE